MNKLWSVTGEAEIIIMSSQCAFDVGPYFSSCVSIPVNLEPVVDSNDGLGESLSICLHTKTLLRTPSVGTPVKCETCKMKDIPTFGSEIDLFTLVLTELKVVVS